jgi:hypothetical protein
MLDRRQVLQATGGALASWATATPAGAARGRARVLVFTRSAGYQHEVVKLSGASCRVHDVVRDVAGERGIDVECTKDGRVFTPESLARFDACFFFTTGDLTAEKSEDGFPPMPKAGKQALLDAIAGGKGFVGSHSASDTFLSPGGRRDAQSPAQIDPYIAMLGGEFIGHNEIQPATMRVTGRGFPGVPTDDFSFTDEWYSLKNFADDLHVILVQETHGMKGLDYDRPAYPATWARRHGLGRVFYTSMGHRPETWSNLTFRQLLAGGLEWATGRVHAEVPPNLRTVAPRAAVLPPKPEKK